MAYPSNIKREDVAQRARKLCDPAFLSSVRRRRDAGDTMDDIGRQHGISRSTVRNILMGAYDDARDKDARGGRPQGHRVDIPPPRTKREPKQVSASRDVIDAATRAFAAGKITREELSRRLRA